MRRDAPSGLNHMSGLNHIFFNITLFAGLVNLQIDESKFSAYKLLIVIGSDPIATNTVFFCVTLEEKNHQKNW